MYYLGVDLGGTTIKVGLVNENFKILEYATCDTLRDRHSSAILKDMAALCQAILEKRGLTEKDIHSIGIGCPGIASPIDGIIYSASNLDFKNVNVKEEIQKYMNVDVFVENDANCAALGEVLAGVAKNEKNVVVVTLGTGVGGGIIVDGQIFRGSFFGGGEIGHQVIQVSDGLPCGCGRKGCWEQYASATALIRLGKEAARHHADSMLHTLAKDGDIEQINAKVIFDAAKAGDAISAQVLEDYFQYIACGVANLINILEPNMIVLGGGMSAQKEYLSDSVKKYVQHEMYGGHSLKTTIKTAILGNDAGIIGAAFLGKTMI